MTAERLVAVAPAPSGSGAFECLGAPTGDLKRQERIEEDENMASTETSWRCRWGAFWMGLVVGSWSKRRRLSWPASAPVPAAETLPSRISPGEDTLVTTMEGTIDGPKSNSPCFLYIELVHTQDAADTRMRDGRLQLWPPIPKRNTRAILRPDKPAHIEKRFKPSKHGHYSKEHGHDDPKQQARAQQAMSPTPHPEHHIARQSSSPCHHPQAAPTVKKG